MVIVIGRLLSMAANDRPVQCAVITSDDVPFSTGADIADPRQSCKGVGERPLIARTADDWSRAQLAQIELVDKDANRIVLIHPVFQAFRPKRFIRSPAICSNHRRESHTKATFSHNKVIAERLN
jgi:enoyl-CoA hydratase/carnithine racemase